MSVAIVIVNYRVYEDVDRALTSVAPFLSPRDEVLVFDQASDHAKLDRLARAHPFIRTVASAANVGFAAGVNAATRASSAPYVLLLNPDAVLEGPVPGALAEWMAAHPGVAVAGPRIVDEDGAVQASARRFPGPSTVLAGRSTWLTARFPDNWLSRRNLPARSADAPRAVDWLAGSCFMTRRDVFDRLGGFDEGFFLYWEDADYCRRATALGYACMYVPVVTVRHIGGRSAARDRALAIRAFHRSAARLQQKHAGAAGRLIAPLVRAGMWVRGEALVRFARRGTPRPPEQTSDVPS